MTNNNSNGNRDDELETIRQLLIATARRTESNSEAIEGLTSKLDRLTVTVDQFGVRVDQLGERVDQLGERLDQLGERVDQLTSTVERIATDAEADRAVMLGMLEDQAELRRENRQILDYLIRRDSHPNTPEN